MERCKNYEQAHIFPFLWIHGEESEDIEREIRAIRDCGIKEFCVESRPHPDFCKEGWWKDFDCILRLAKKYGMRVWLLDDKHFPTGYANGAVEQNGDFAPLCLRAFFLDFYADTELCRFIVNDNADDEAFGVFLFEREGDSIVYDSCKEVTDDVRENVVSIRVEKKGYFRLVAVFKTRRYSERALRIDTINSVATDALLKNVYEPHYERYKEEFGKTFVGFFSDEPRFFNGLSEPYFNHATRYEIKPGMKGVVYPFSEELARSIKLTEDKSKVVALWEDVDGCAQWRIDYMNAITDLYQRNFSDKIGRWCVERGVSYVGHVVEDMGAHCRLGIGAGHYFKAISGQNMSGIDLVLHQIERGFFEKNHFYACKTLMNDSTFFYFTLAKLAVSAAHLDEKKKDRAFCEIFGAYGWGETLAQMKYFIDFMLVRGINYFVPHAFNPKLDDDDCPPYFYYGGMNPSFSGFKELMKYTERMCELLSVPYDVPVAVLYEAEADWAGVRRRSMDEVNKELFERQIDFEIVPSYDLKKTRAKVLIVPYAKDYGCLAEKHIAEFDGIVIRQRETGGVLDELLAHVKLEYELVSPNPNVRILKRGDRFFVLNEGVEVCENAIRLPSGERLDFRLEGGEATLIDKNTPPLKSLRVACELPAACEVYLRGGDEQSFTRLTGVDDYTVDINALTGYENFTGVIAYALQFDAKIEDGKRVYLDFGTLSGGVRVRLNGKESAELFGIPYRVEVSDSIRRRGSNELWVELSTSLALKFKDKLSKYCKIDKGGLNENIKLLIE